MNIPFRSFHQQHTIKNIFGANWSGMCVTIRRRKFSKKLRFRFLLKLRNRGFKNMSSPNYSNTSHIREGINYSFLEGEAMFSLSQGVEATSSPLVLIPRSSEILSTTNNSNNTSAREDTRILGHHQEITSTGGSSSIRQATWHVILKIWQKNAENIFYNMNLSFFSEFPKNDQYKAESMFGPSYVHAKSEEADGHVIWWKLHKIFVQIRKICKACWRPQYLYRSGKRAQHQKAARSLIKAFFLVGKDWENTVNNMGIVKKGCTHMCAPATVNLYKQTKVDLFST